MLFGIVTAVALALFAIFLASDADLPLILLPNPPAKANAGKVVWIVGASSGIGAYLAEDYCRDDANVIISARRVNQLEEIAEKCAKASGTNKMPLVLPLDITNYDEHEPAFKKIISTYGKIDVLVLNAGSGQRNLAVDTPFSVTENIMKLNFFSFISLNKIVLPTMLAQKSGKVNFISLRSIV
jgi:short-subunit dehydrogenase